MVTKALAFLNKDFGQCSAGIKCRVFLKLALKPAGPGRAPGVEEVGKAGPMSGGLGGVHHPLTAKVE